jgi:HD-like signal output (HDOD) protein
MPSIFPDLNNNGNTDNSNHQADGSKNSVIRDRLLKKFSLNDDLLSLGITISRVVELASSDDEGTHHLANHILSDVALTQKILRLANTVFYRNISTTPVSTVSRAIFLLGFNTVKTTALALLLIERLSKGTHTDQIRRELIESLCASLVGRELARNSHLPGVEEASIAALFKNLGRILLASQEYPLYREIDHLIQNGTQPVQAEIKVIGCSYEFLTESILRLWNIPEMLIFALNPLAHGPIKQAKTRQEWMRQVVCFSHQAQHLILQHEDNGSSSAAQALTHRFGISLNLDQHKVRQLFSVVAREINQVAQGLNLHKNSEAPPPSSLGDNLGDRSGDNPSDRPGDKRLPAILKLATMNPATKATDERHPSGKPTNARDLLLCGIQVATQMMAGARYKPSELILLVVETLHTSLGFRFSAACINDNKSGQFRAVITMGDQHTMRQTRFNFPSDSGSDVFHLALDNQADLMIADAMTPKIRDLLPAWHRSLLPDARSVMILPLVAENTPVGLFYGDRTRPAPEGIPSDEAALIKTLVGQMLTAISLRQKAS